MQDEDCGFDSRTRAKQFKFSLNQILQPLFTLRDDESRIFAVMSSIVDDLLCGYALQGSEAMKSVLQHFLVGKEEHGTFRFCGKEFRQDEDFGIHVTAKNNIERVQPITYDAKHGLTRIATADEIHQLRSVTQSLAWIARQTRPDLSYRIWEIQSTFENVCVGDLRECNRLWSMQHLHPDAALQRSVTPVCVQNRSNLTESLRTLIQNKFRESAEFVAVL